MPRDLWTTVPALAARDASLLPLQAEDAPGLAEAAADGQLWTLPWTNVPQPGEMAAYVQRALVMHSAGVALPFAVRDATGTIVGSTRFYQLAREVPRLTIGYTWYAARAQRTAVNTSAKRLLLEHAFDVLDCEAVAFETSHLNLASQAAIERLGARRDGLLRAHMRHRDGSLRDTVAYSIIRDEWPAVRARLDARLGRGP